MKVIYLAAICHEANRQYCASVGDDSQFPWAEAPDWQKESAVAGVNFHIDNPDAGHGGGHQAWLDHKEADGWVYGEVKDAEAKTHPCMVPYDDLPQEQKMKDILFLAIVNVFRGYVIRD